MAHQEDAFGRKVIRHDSPAAELADVARTCGQFCDAVVMALENPQKGDFARLKEVIKDLFAESLDALQRAEDHACVQAGQQGLGV